MKINKKITILVISFLLAIPFRLPISILLIKLFNSIAQMEGTEIAFEILRANVMCTKIIYNLILSILFIYNIEMLSIDIKGRRAIEGSHNHETVYWWTLVIGIIFATYMCFDGYWTYELFNSIMK